jgi:hypothetical protein
MRALSTCLGFIASPTTRTAPTLSITLLFCAGTAIALALRRPTPAARASTRPFGFDWAHVWIRGRQSRDFGVLRYWQDIHTHPDRLLNIAKIVKLVFSDEGEG